MATKLSRMVTNFERLLAIMILYPFVTWSCRSRDKLKPLFLHYYHVYGQNTWQDGNLTWAVSAHKVIWPYMTCLARSRHKLKSLCIHYHNACDYQTWHEGIYNEELRFINSHNPLITWSWKVTWNIRSPMVTNLARWLLTMRSFHLQSYTTPEHVINWQIENVLPPLPQNLHPPKLATCDQRWKAPNHKVTWPFK